MNFFALFDINFVVVLDVERGICMQALKKNGAKMNRNIETFVICTVHEQRTPFTFYLVFQVLMN